MDLLEHLLGELSLYSIFSRVPYLGLQLLFFFTDPSQFTRDWLASPTTRPPVGVVLVWAIGIFAVLRFLTRYMVTRLGFARESLIEDTGNTEASESNITPQPSSGERSTPKVLQVMVKRPSIGRERMARDPRWSESRFSATWMQRFIFPYEEIEEADKPQLLIFNSGLFYVLIDNVVPDQLATKKAQTLLLCLTALMFVIGVHPMSYLLEGATAARPSFAEAVEFQVNVGAFFLVCGSILSPAVVFATRFLDRVGERDDDRWNRLPFTAATGCLFTVFSFAGFLVSGRAVWLSLLTFYAFSPTQLIIALVGSAFITAVVSPILFVPSILLFLRFRQIIEL